MLDLLNKAKIKGIRVNQYRLYHSNECNYKNIGNILNELKENNNLLGEKNLLEKFIIELNEIKLTLRLLVAYFMHIILLLNSFLFVFYIHIYNIKLIGLTSKNMFIYTFYIFGLLLYIYYKKLKTTIIMTDSSIDLSNSVYNKEIEQEKSVK